MSQRQSLPIIPVSGTLVAEERQSEGQRSTEMDHVQSTSRKGHRLHSFDRDNEGTSRVETSNSQMRSDEGSVGAGCVLAQGSTQTGSVSVMRRSSRKRHRPTCVCRNTESASPRYSLAETLHNQTQSSSYQQTKVSFTQSPHRPRLDCDLEPDLQGRGLAAKRTRRSGTTQRRMSEPSLSADLNHRLRHVASKDRHNSTVTVGFSDKVSMFAAPAVGISTPVGLTNLVNDCTETVSYTHLTLPTKRIV